MDLETELRRIISRPAHEEELSDEPSAAAWSPMPFGRHEQEPGPREVLEDFSALMRGEDEPLDFV